MRRKWVGLVSVAALVVGGVAYSARERLRSDDACREMAMGGLRPVAQSRTERFLGKVQEATAECRGGSRAVERRGTPWVDWANYWGTGDASTLYADPLDFLTKHTGPNDRGIDGALMDLEYQRLELIAFNLHDPSTYEAYVSGRDGRPGASLQVWPEMRLPPGHREFLAVGGAAEQLCSGELIRHRTLTGICNDIRNPLMGSTGMVFARNVQFEEAFPDLGENRATANRHGERLGLLKPDPQVISRRLFTRDQSLPDRCNAGLGLPGGDGHCDYQKAPFFNVLAAFWIQFMTHDWFGHLDEGRNSPDYMDMGCQSQKEGDQDVPLSPDQAQKLGCRPGDRMEKALVAEQGPSPTFESGGKALPRRPHRTTRNTVTAWWDASQIYGYDETSRRRVKRDPADAARLLMERLDRPGEGESLGYLPLLADCAGSPAGSACDPMNPAWRGQEATAFPDNWTIGLSFFHNVFAREHNAFVAEFRRRARDTPEADSGLRDPARPDRVISYAAVTPDELFEAARLVVAAEIAKIHTIEWTTQLLYNEPLFRAMNSNWGGLFEGRESIERVFQEILTRLQKSGDPRKANQLYSVLAAGPGIFGLGSRRYEGAPISASPRTGAKDIWSLALPEHVNGGVNHFGSPFNFPEEFVTVYRLHPLVPDLLEYRDAGSDPNAVREMLPVVSTFRGKATEAMRSRGIANLALSMGRQRLGLLTLRNHPAFLQDLPMPRLEEGTQKLDVAALDLVRDRERGIPRFNEFRRQYGLRGLARFDDFVDARLPAGSPERRRQEELVKVLREVYGQHECDPSKQIAESQLLDGRPIDDCFGNPRGTLVDNVEDVDMVVGMLAEFTRPHGFAISETQFVVFILNASRRLFSDRFFTSSFRPEFYTSLGVEWVTNNGPGGPVLEKGRPNGHRVPVSPLKRVLLRTVPELAPELDPVVNVFDPWARDRGEYYSLAWKPRAGAEQDPAFQGE